MRYTAEMTPDFYYGVYDNDEDDWLALGNLSRDLGGLSLNDALAAADWFNEDYEAAAKYYGV